jgi:arylsulfatase A-like enzyme
MESSLPKYHEHIRYVDRLTGEIVAALRQRGLFDEAMLVIMSDHNWVSEPDRGLREQRTVVPLVIKWPGQREGVTVAARTCLVGLQALLGRVQAGVPGGVPSAAAMDSLARESCA